LFLLNFCQKNRYLQKLFARLPVGATSPGFSYAFNKRFVGNPAKAGISFLKT
jgi:hypothetical protein